MANHAETPGSPIRQLPQKAKRATRLKRRRHREVEADQASEKPSNRRCKPQSRGAAGLAATQRAVQLEAGTTVSNIASTMSGASMVMRSTSAAQPGSSFRRAKIRGCRIGAVVDQPLPVNALPAF